MTLHDKYTTLVSRGMPEPDDFGWSGEWRKFYVVTKFEDKQRTILLFNEKHAEAIVAAHAMAWWISLSGMNQICYDDETAICNNGGICYGDPRNGMSILDAILAATA